MLSTPPLVLGELVALVVAALVADDVATLVALEVLTLDVVAALVALVVLAMELVAALVAADVLTTALVGAVVGAVAGPVSHAATRTSIKGTNNKSSLKRLRRYMLFLLRDINFTSRDAFTSLVYGQSARCVYVSDGSFRYNCGI